MPGFNLTITNEGSGFLASVIANQGNIDFTEMRFSSTNYVGQEAALTEGTWAGTFITATPSASVVDLTTININGSFNNSSLLTDQDLYSIGLIAEDGNGNTALVAVATTSTPDPISHFILNPSTYAYNIDMVVSSTADITVSASVAGVVFVSDIVDNLSSSNANKPLSANQGRALSLAKQNKELATPLTIGGVSQTTVEGALGALNKSKTERTEISNVEATTTASDNYASGAYIYVESLGGIYKATTAITSGQTMTPGTNLSSVPVTVGEELTALNSNLASLRASGTSNTTFGSQLAELATVYNSLTISQRINAYITNVDDVIVYRVASTNGIFTRTSSGSYIDIQSLNLNTNKAENQSYTGSSWTYSDITSTTNAYSLKLYA